MQDHKSHVAQELSIDTGLQYLPKFYGMPSLEVARTTVTQTTNQTTGLNTFATQR